MKGWIIAAAALLVAGCVDAKDMAPRSERNAALWTDPATGCRYIVYRRGAGSSAVGSLSIRFLANGQPDCPGSQQ